MKSSSDIDFTRGSIVSALIRFALPVMAGELLQNLYNSADSLIVGNFISATALAAVGICSTLSQMLIGFFNGMSVGCTVVVARLFGKNDREGTAEAIRHTYTFSLVLGVLLSVLGILLAPALLHLSGANDEIFGEALSYLRVYLAGLMFTVIYNSGAGIVRAVGDTRTPFYILIVTSTVNVALDLVFVTVLPLGTVGVALATVVSQLLSVVLITAAIRSRTGSLRLDVRDTFKNGRGVIRGALDVGFFAGMQSAVITFSNVFIWRYVNAFPTASVAGISIAQRLDKFVSLPCGSYGHAMTTFTGQNQGAGNYARIKDGILKGVLLSWGTTLALALVIYPTAPFLARLFNGSDDVVSVAVEMLHTLIPLYGFMGFRDILQGALRGSGKSSVPMWLSVAGMVGIRQLFLAVGTRLSTDISVIFYSYPVGWASVAVMILVYFLLVRKKIHLGD